MELIENGKKDIWIALILILVVSTTFASAADSKQLAISPMKVGQAVLLSPDDIRIEIVTIDSFYVRINVTSSSNRFGNTRTIGTGDTGDFLTPIETNSVSISRIALAQYGDSVGLTLYSNSDLRIIDYIDVNVATDINTATVPLTVGWNLVALIGTPANTTAASVMSSVADNISVVWGYNNSASASASAVQPWVLYDPAMPPALNSLKTIVPGKGYWIYANADCEWNA